MRGLADGGVAVLMISSDMEEVIGASDRIAVMHEGRISGYLEKDQFSQENVLLLAVGKPARGAAAMLDNRMAGERNSVAIEPGLAGRPTQ
jgi:ribose transport system ATP-binding protein